MRMNNVYYRFPYLSGNDNCRTIPARLRMQAIRIVAVIYGASAVLDTEAAA